MPYLDLIDETLDINSTENYDLSVELSPDNLSFIILDSIRNKFILLRSYKPENDNKYTAENLGEMIKKDEFLTKKYRKTDIIAPSCKFTLVPSPLYDPEKKDDYFLLNHSLQENQTILVNRLKEPDSYLIYSQLKSLNELVNKIWPDQKICHHLKPFLASASITAFDHKDYLFIHVEKEFFNLALFCDNKLKLCNSFTYRNSSDILYYTLNIVKNHGLKQDTQVIFSGQLKKRDDLHSGFSEYMRNIKFAEPGHSFTFSYVMNDADTFRYINIISVGNCV